MKNNSALSFTQKATTVVLKTLLVATPLLVLPFTRNLIVDSKLFLMFVVALLTILGFAVKTFAKKKWPKDLPSTDSHGSTRSSYSNSPYLLLAGTCASSASTTSRISSHSRHLFHTRFLELNLTLQFQQ